VAIHVLKRLIDLENNAGVLRNPQNPTFRGSIAGVRTPTNEVSSNSNESFLRLAFINMLLDIVYRSRQPRVILDGLRVVSRDTLPGDQAAYKERMLEETLTCVSEGVFSLEQTCDAVVAFSTFFPDRKRCRDAADKLWAGIVDRAEEIDKESIASVYRALPHLHTSREVILRLAEDRVGLEGWQGYRPKAVLEMLRALTELHQETKGYRESKRTLRVLSQWLRLNVHSLSEEELLAVVFCLHRLDYVDTAAIDTLERWKTIDARPKIIFF